PVDFAQVLQHTMATETDADADADLYRELFPAPEASAADVRIPPAQPQDEDGWQRFLAEMGTGPIDPTAPSAAELAPPAAELGAAAEVAETIATVTQMSNSPARARLDVLMQLRDVGVPIGINPRSETHDIYQAMEDVLAELPTAPALPRAGGEIIALVGELTPALRTATTIAQQLRIPAAAIWVAGIEGHPVQALPGFEAAGGPQHRSIHGAQHAGALQAELRAGDVPAIVVVVTDSVEGDPQDAWAGDLLAALAPTVTWLMVDATAKPDDERAKLDRLGGSAIVDALAVHSARISTSPATTWDLGLPIALLDGRPANTFTWSSLLFGALHSGARHQATA
ncbi:MAG: flhF, partial [Frankiales bacterium]|nr:flhF [Frankiales bacterium]